ncbi:MAG: hypothetical protein WAN52_09105 [Pseudolabrys sp.]|jgi:hypothetical protein
MVFQFYSLRRPTSARQAKKAKKSDLGSTDLSATKKKKSKKLDKSEILYRIAA